MRSDEPSLTARGVAMAWARIDRPAWPSGDPDADVRLAASLGDMPRRSEALPRDRGTGEFRSFMVPRTEFFDAAVVSALVAGVDQIVILGAGDDGRALRYRTPGVQFFEVDHPATQADKLRRLRDIDASLEGIVFVTSDFTEPGLGDALYEAGFDSTRPAQFLCEGVLRYLPEEWFRELLRSSATIAAPGSRLAVSISTRDGDPDEREQTRDRALAESGEAVFTVPPMQVALQWLAESGWTEVSTDVASRDDANRRRLLVDARRV